jgi:hypothetical protein
VPARPIRTLNLDDLVLLVARCLSGFTHFVIFCHYKLVAEVDRGPSRPVGDVPLASVNAAKLSEGADEAFIRFLRTTLAGPCRV